SRLLDFPGVKEVVVTAGTENTGDKYLCAYIVSNRPRETGEMREYLAANLPDYMIPAYFMTIDTIPLAANGKVQRRELPAPRVTVNPDPAVPRSHLEKTLAAIWGDVLALAKDRIDIDANFFQLGGHSLKATIMAAKIHKHLLTRVSLAEIFKAPTIRALAVFIRENRAKKEFHEAVPPAEAREYYELAPAQKRLYILQDMNPAGTVYNLSRVIPLDQGIKKKKLEQTFQQ
ncbi:MAG: hypothetical protein GY940_24045, partial [bacterium]|nr:hypothetical protein [bacterium]